MASTTRRRFVTISAAALAAPALPRGAAAQAWPAGRSIRAICPFTAGSTIDILGRIITDPLAQALGQTIVVENRGGAGGSIGSAAVARADPDGYTILINASAHTAAPAAYPNIAYDPARDFAGVAMIGVVPNVLLIAPSKGINSAKELAERAKAGDMSYASAGVGSATHWAAERFRLSAGFKATHIPFRGGPDALTEVMTGRVDFICIGTSSGLPFIRDGKLVPLAVTTQKRSAALPEVPTTLELGFADSDYTFWNGFLAPAQTPRPIVERLHGEISKILEQPAVKDRLAPQGVEPLPLSPAEFDELMRREIAVNLALAKAAGLKFN
jgi:tripartite-type tricarboxylate transporter receptor subunit TctC